MPRRPLCAALRAIEFDHPLDYEWNEPDTQSYFLYAEEDELDRLKLLTGRANIALALAVGEWIEARFRLYGLDPEFSDYLDAGWAGLLDTSYCEWIYLDYPHWRGPVRSPQLLVMGIVNEAFHESEDNPEMAWRACYALNLARYLLPEAGPFEDWLEASLVRLEKWHSWDSEGTEPDDIFAEEYWQGNPVARELFDPDRPYQADQAEGLLEAFVLTVNRENPFLNPDD